VAAETAGEERPGGNDFAAVGDGGGMTGGGAVGAAACDTEGSPEGDEGAPDSGGASMVTLRVPVGTSTESPDAVVLSE